MATFKESKLYTAICSGNHTEVLNLLNGGEDVSLRDSDGSTYLHLAVQQKVDQELLIELVSFVDVTERDINGDTALDLLLKSTDPQYARNVVHVIPDYIMNVILDCDVETLDHLVTQGWSAWPIRGLDDLQEYEDAAQYLRGVTDLKSDTADIHHAAQDGELRTLKIIMEHKSDATLRDLAGMTPLHKAVIFQHMHVVGYFLSNFDNIVNLKDHMDRTPLHYAAAQENIDIYELLKEKADETIEDSLGNTAKYYENNQNRLDPSKMQETVMFMMHLPDLEEKVNDIHDAVGKDDLTRFKQLVDRRKLSVMRDGSGMSPLHKAVLYEHTDIVRHILQNFPEAIKTTDNWERVPLHYAAILPDKGYMYKILTSAGADEEVLDEKQKSPKHYLQHIDELNVKKVKEISEYLPKISEFQVKVANLHAAVKEGDITKVKNLLDRKRLVNMRDATGLTILHKAVIFEHSDIIKHILRTFPETVDIKDHMGRTPNHYAFALKDKGYIAKLLKMGNANDDVKDLSGHTPQYFSENMDQLDITVIKHKLDQPQATIVRPVFTPRPPSSGRSRPSSRSRPGSRRSGRPSSGQGMIDDSSKPTYVRPARVTEDPYKKLKSSPPETIEAQYVAQALGVALTMSLAEIAERRPWDPIEYLAQWLHKYSKTLQQKEDEAELTARLQFEIEDQERQKEMRKKRREEMKQIKEEEERQRREAEEEERKRKQEEEEKERRHKEDSLAQPPHLPTLKEEDEEESGKSSVRAKDENGQTELHRTATKPGGNIAELLEQGYNIAERDANGKTARECAIEAGIEEYAEVIDNYILDLFKKESYQAIEQLILDGYHSNMPDIAEKLGQDHLDEEAKEALESIKVYEEKIQELHKTLDSEDGTLRTVKQLLDRKKITLAKDSKGRSSLHKAVIRGDKELVEYIVNNFPTTLAARDNMDRTPLHYAYAISDEVADILVKAGSNMNAKDIKQRLPNSYQGKKEDLDI